ncbi:MAG: hypothetical protein ABGX04_18605 [Myxococcales bacterium]
MLIGVIAALLFVLISTVRLGAQGMYYDELHQAAAAFVYQGKPAAMFAENTLAGIPILNMSYSGAIKTNVYGIYLALFDASFSVVSWRLFGILLVAAGMLLLALIAGRQIGAMGLFVFFLLLISDAFVVLASRHDWGPIALALALRLLLIATYIRGETRGEPPRSNSFWLGFLLCFSVFEKLSSVVLVPIVLIMMASNPRRRSRPHLMSFAKGGGVGSLLLVVANVVSLIKRGNLSSLSQVGSNRGGLSVSGFFEHLVSYFGLGNGHEVRGFILGQPPDLLGVNVERIGLLLLLIVVAGIAASGWRRNRMFRMSGLMLVSYLVIALMLYLLPNGVWAHHWVIGTPFQYAAVALVVSGLRNGSGNSSTSREAVLQSLPSSRLTVAFSLFLAVLVVARLVSLWSVEESLLRGEAGERWNPGFTRVGEILARKGDDAIVVVADWGIATQIHCLANGRPGFVQELFWRYESTGDISSIDLMDEKKTIFVVTMTVPTGVRPDVTQKLWQDLDRLSEWMPGWEEVPAGQDFAEIEVVEVRKFVRTGSRSNSASGLLKLPSETTFGYGRYVKFLWGAPDRPSTGPLFGPHDVSERSDTYLYVPMH